MVRQADSHESLEFPIRANHPIRANRANRFARITPLRQIIKSSKFLGKALRLTHTPLNEGLTLHSLN